jgi:hypothetical protein
VSAKVRIKAGQVEFEYEGETELSMDDIKDLFSHIEGLFSSSIASTVELPSAKSALSGEMQETPKPNAHAPVAQLPKLHVNSVAEKLGGQTGVEVAIAAAAYLQLMSGKEAFTRRELLSAMKDAKKFYNQNMSANLSRILNQLVGSKFNQIGNDQYSLKAADIKEIESKLAQH